MLTPTSNLQEYATADGPLLQYSFACKEAVVLDQEQESDALTLLLVTEGAVGLRTREDDWSLQPGTCCLFRSRLFQLCLPDHAKLQFLLYNIEPLVKRMDLGVFTTGRFQPTAKMQSIVAEILQPPVPLGFPEKWYAVQLSHLLLALLEQMEQPAPVDEDKQLLRQYALLADNYIRQHLTEDLTTLQIARAVGLNECSLKQLFSEQFGTGMAKRQNHLRIMLAKDLLVQTNKSIRDIIQECGYLREATFRENFDKLTQLTPAEYRKMYKK
ncbi:MAG: helix-turn-helix transcriptional regulator [Flavipsychrobacter sp.]|nr:helix-turn-helix transcriptional regulator [Flavipsychrobacter sp.]